MALIQRLIKGSPLTYLEIDTNFTYLLALIPQGADVYAGTWDPNTNKVSDGTILSDSSTYAKGYYVNAVATAVTQTSTVSTATTNSTTIPLITGVSTGPGASITGAGIPAGTRIVSAPFGSNNITISNAVSLAANVVVSISPVFSGITDFVTDDILFFNGTTWSIQPGMTRTTSAAKTLSVLATSTQSSIFPPSVDAVNTGLSLKSNTASPTFTGVPSAPTATIGDSSTQLATTSFIVQSLLSQQTPIVVTRTDGTSVYLNSWPTITDATIGSVIRIRSNFGVSTTAYVIPSICSIRIDAGSVFTCGSLNPQAAGTPGSLLNRITISGAGTLAGNIILYGQYQTTLFLQDFRHEGRISLENSTVNQIIANVSSFGVTAVPPAGEPYLMTLSRDGASGGASWFTFKFYNCRFTVSGTSGPTSSYVNAKANTIASVFMLSALNYSPGANDAIDQTNCILEAVGCSFFGDGTNSVLSQYGGFATFKFGNSTVEGIVAPSVAIDPSITAFGVGSGSNAQNSLSPSSSKIPTTVDAVNAGLSLKANISSPAFTGTPTAPLATLNDYTTTLATTKFVRDQIGNRLYYNYPTASSGSSGDIQDVGNSVWNNTGSGLLTLRLHVDQYYTDLGFASTIGTFYYARQSSTGAVQVTTNSSDGYSLPTVNYKNTTGLSSVISDTFKIERTAPNTWLVTPVEGTSILTAVNNLTSSSTSNTSVPSIDAVNTGLALKANTADVNSLLATINATDAVQTASINILKKAIVVGSNTGNGSQAPVSVGGYAANVTGLESASVGGGAIAISGSDSATVGGYQLTISGNACAAFGSGYSQVTGTLGVIGGVYSCYNRSQYSAIFAGVSHSLPVGADYCAIIGGSGFTAPANATETVYMPRVSLFKPGGGVSMISPDGITKSTISLDNNGKLLGVLPGVLTNSIQFTSPDKTQTGTLTLSNTNQLLLNGTSVAPAATSTPVATTTTVGTVMVGQNTAISADGAGTLTVSGVYRGIWVTATFYKANDTVLNPSGQLVSSIADHTSGASYTATNWNAVITNPVIATTSVAGLVMIGSGIVESSIGIISVPVVQTSMSTSTLSPSSPPSVDAVNAALLPITTDVATLKSISNAPIIAQLLNGTISVYSTVQSAADAIYSGGGGTIILNGDAVGPVSLNGNTSISANGHALRVISGSSVDTLTLNNYTGTINIGMIERSGTGSGYALVMNGGNAYVNGNTLGTVSYNTIFGTGGTLVYNGIATLSCNRAQAPGGGDMIAVLATGSCQLTTYGSIVHTTDAANSVAVEAGAQAGPVFNCYSTINVTNKGGIARVQAGKLSLHGSIVSADQGIYYNQSGTLDIYSSVDLRKSTFVAATGLYGNPLVSSQTGRFDSATMSITLWPGHALLGAPGYTSIANGYTNQVQLIKVAGALAINKGLDANISLIPLTTGKDVYSSTLYTSTIALDFMTSNVQTILLTDAVSFNASTNIAISRTKKILLINTTSSSLPITFNSSWHSSVSYSFSSFSLSAGYSLLLDLVAATGSTESDIYVIATVYVN